MTTDPLQRRSLLLGAAALAAALAPQTSPGVTVLFSETFDAVPLATSPTFGAPNAFSRTPPSGWDIADNVPPGGVPEFAGWSIVRKAFWQNVGANFGNRAGRGGFTRSSGSLAVADADLWNGPPGNDPANREGFFNSVLVTRPIDLSPRRPNETRLRLAFDSSWLGPECCDDGDFLPTPLRNRNNQTAVVRVRFNGGPPVEVLRWESAPFREPSGAPSSSPIGPNGSANLPNPFYRPLGLNERLFIDLSGLLAPASGSEFEVPTAALFASGSAGDEVQVEIGLEDAGEDGWWGIDDVEMASFATVLGDMNLSGGLDVGDYDAFALGMLDTEAYRDAYWGELPVTNGSLDSVFDFDDIPWFVSIMEGVGPPSTSFARAFFGVPEPGAGVAALTAMGAAAAPTRRRRR